MNWFVIIPFAIVVIALVVFLVKRNIKDEKDFEEKIKHDYPHIRDEEGDIEIDEVKK